MFTIVTKNKKVTEVAAGYNDALVQSVASKEYPGVVIKLRRSYTMNEQTQPAAIEIWEGKKASRIQSKGVVALMAMLDKKTVFKEFEESNLLTVDDISTLEDVS